MHSRTCTIASEELNQQQVTNLEKLLAAAKAANANAPEIPQLQSDLATARAKLAATQAITKDLLAAKPRFLYPSAAFWADLLQNTASDTSLHRVQMVLFTVLFGIVFVLYTATHITMPEFSATMLALIGISSATYVGFKFQ